jgi:hypothetical protein
VGKVSRQVSYLDTQIFAVSGKRFFVGGDSTNVYAGPEAFLKTSNFLFLVPAPPG